MTKKIKTIYLAIEAKKDEIKKLKAQIKVMQKELDRYNGTDVIDLVMCKQISKSSGRWLISAGINDLKQLEGKNLYMFNIPNMTGERLRPIINLMVERGLERPYHDWEEYKCISAQMKGETK